MRTLSNSLLSAQRSGASLPYVKVEIVAKVGGVTRFNWERLYQGGEPDYFHAIAMPGDGSLIRLRVDPADNKLYWQKV